MKNNRNPQTKKEGGEEKMEVTFDSLTKTIKNAEGAQEKALGSEKFYWNGYLSALRELRNNINSKN